MLRDYQTAPISDAERALFKFVDKVNKHSTEIRRDDLDEARRAGWSDEALYYAISVCALFNFYNRWVDASGVHDLPAGAYAMQAQRLKDGYLHAVPSSGEAVAAGQAKQAVG